MEELGRTVTPTWGPPLIAQASSCGETELPMLNALFIFWRWPLSTSGAGGVLDWDDASAGRARRHPSEEEQED